MRSVASLADAVWVAASARAKYRKFYFQVGTKMACRFSCHMARFATASHQGNKDRRLTLWPWDYFRKKAQCRTIFPLNHFIANEIGGGGRRERERASLTRALVRIIYHARENLKKKEKNHFKLILEHKNPWLDNGVECNLKKCWKNRSLISSIIRYSTVSSKACKVKMERNFILSFHLTIPRTNCTFT